MALGRQENTLEEAIEQHKSILLSVYSKLPLEKLKQLSEIDESFKQLVAPLIKTLIHQNDRFDHIMGLPNALTKQYLGDFRSVSEIACLSQVNRFFRNTFKEKLATERAEKIDLFNKRLGNLFNNIDPANKTKVEYQKLLKISALMEAFLNKKEPFDCPDQCSKLILTHAYDLDKKNKNASQLGGYEEDAWGEKTSLYTPYLDIKKDKTSDRDCLIMSGISLMETELNHLVETYRRHYPTLNTKLIKRESYAYDISFDLDPFLRTMLPRILGLGENPAKHQIDKGCTRFLF